MGIKSLAIWAAGLAAASMNLGAQETAPTPQVEKAALACSRGFAATYVVQCDPAPAGANPLARLTTPDGAHVAICAAATPTCQPIANFDPNARPGHEVLDSAESDLVIVGFGLDRLLGVAP